MTTPSGIFSRVGAREAAKKDQLRRRHRLGEFPLHHGHRPTDAGKAWTKKTMDWIQAHVGLAQLALEATLAHDLHEAKTPRSRFSSWSVRFDDPVAQASPEIRSVIEALRALRSVAQMTAATIVCD